ncbi:MAG: hypothetical protein J6M91_09205 [Methanobrevibacter sp.]|nr:hypothetical protein [Methanobrevibacter sp.]
MNCSDTAPHQKEIEILSRAGFSPEAINAILAFMVNNLTLKKWLIT